MWGAGIGACGGMAWIWDWGRCKGAGLEEEEGEEVDAAIWC